MAVIWAVVVWGAAIAAFGLVGAHLRLALLFLAIAGAADVISAIFRNTILQLDVPGHLRGRLSSIHILVVTGGPRLGDFEAGLGGDVFTPTISVVSGGLACIVGAAVVALATRSSGAIALEPPPDVRSAHGEHASMTSRCAPHAEADVADAVRGRAPGARRAEPLLPASRGQADARGPGLARGLRGPRG